MAFAVLEKVYAADRIERQFREGFLDKEAVHCATRGLQCKRLSYQQLFSDVMVEKVKKYENDVMTPLAMSCHSVNKSCANYDSHNVVNLKFHVIFS